MKKYINTSNYYLSTTTSKIENTGTSGTFDVSDVTVDGVTLPLTGYYWVDVDFGDASKREIFRIVSRSGYTLTYDDRISPNGISTHQSGASVGLRDFSQLLNSLSTNTDNFGEVEKTGDLSILVRGGNVFLSGNAKADTGVKEIPSKQFNLQPSTVTYIVVDIDEVAYTFTDIIDTTYLLEEGQYPIAKITTGANAISEIKDLRSTMIGGGDMRSAVYDPEGKRRELFLMDNMEQSEDGEHMFVDQDSITKWNDYETNKQDTLIGEGTGQNIHTINGQNIMGPGNFSLDTILTVGWNYYVTNDGAESFIFPGGFAPLTNDAFIVFTDSGTMMVRGETQGEGDYYYNEGTNSIVFTEPLASTEHAYIWAMYNNGAGETQIGSGEITLKFGNIEQQEREWTFGVNQEPNQTVDLGNATISFAQGTSDNVTGSIQTNQQSNSTVLLQGNILVSNAGYEQLPDTKNTDGNWYFIVE